MTYEEAKNKCHIRSAIYRKSIGVCYWKNHTIPLDKQVSEPDKLATDWEEYDPRDDDNGSLFSLND